MRMALTLARRGRGRTSPNPLVGAVVVQRGRVVGVGYHRRAGADHAEVVALARAGTAARGAELFVNLEPCCHYGRTAPCTDAIVRSGVRRVVIGAIDPNPLVNGRGMEQLRRAGITVDHGVLGDECAALNEAFRCYIVEHRPFVTFKVAMTLDGRVATRNGHSRWVSSLDARRIGHRLRSYHDAIIVGIGTVLTDDPQLTCRGLRGGRDPVRVIVDSNLRTPCASRTVQLAGDESSAPTWVMSTRTAPAVRAQALEKAGARVISVASSRGRVRISSMLHHLARQGIVSALLEGGPTLAGSFWSAGLVDRVVAFIAPKLLGDADALPLLYGHGIRSMEQATRLTQVETRRVGEDLMLTGLVER